MKLKYASFNYTKDDGSWNPRDILVISAPSDSYLGVEFEDDESKESFIAYLKEREVFENYLKDKYNLKEAKYRRFKVDKISKLTESTEEI